MDFSESPFHAGERSVQREAGVREIAERVGTIIRDFMPDPHRSMFEALPFVIVGAQDDVGQPWATILSGHGQPFIVSPDPYTLQLHTRVREGDPALSGIAAGRPIGLLGIQLETRRRNRMNGHVTQVAAGGFSVQVDQSYGNCPKYINARTPEYDPARELVAQAPVQLGAALPATVVAIIEHSDTCFIASASASAREHDLGDAREGVDVSHRGGKPGFVRVEQRAGEPTVLWLPDFSGNQMFNTLGNLTRYPRAGLLFVDFESGDVLQLAATAKVVWHGPEVAAFEGAERVVRLEILGGVARRAALPFHFGAAQPSPHLMRTGSWPSR
jgi:predicted pyridoxine 5'-phosphate oxidase superfamily flavin-nucleotide-binding protein